MELRDLVLALMKSDALSARQWVADATRAKLQWSEVAKPLGLDPVEMAVAAGIVELLAQRAGENSPAWTGQVPAAPHPVILVQSAKSMPRLLRLCEQEGPEPLRRRGILAPPDFLTAA